MKKFKNIGTVFSLNLKHVATQIVKIIGILVNHQEPLVKYSNVKQNTCVRLTTFTYYPRQDCSGYIIATNNVDFWLLNISELSKLICGNIKYIFFKIKFEKQKRAVIFVVLIMSTFKDFKEKYKTVLSLHKIYLIFTVQQARCCYFPLFVLAETTSFATDAMTLIVYWVLHFLSTWLHVDLSKFIACLSSCQHHSHCDLLHHTVTVNSAWLHFCCNLHTITWLRRITLAFTTLYSMYIAYLLGRLGVRTSLYL